jgi:translocation and assembly module TamB
VNATVQVREARVAMAPARPKRLQPLAFPSDVVLVAPGRPLDRREARKLRRLRAALGTELADVTEDDGEPAPSRRPLVVHLAIDAPRNLWVEAPDAHLELGLEPGFYVTIADEVHVFGVLDLRRGRIDALGKRFDVDPSSTVHFTGPPAVPVLAVKATHKASSANITIQVTVDGPASGPTMHLQSPDNPQLGDTALLTVLATGHLPDQGPTGGGSATSPTERAASLLGGLVAGQLQKTLAHRLPLDVLTIDPGQGLSGTRLEAGTYLTQDIYVAYVGHIGADPFQRENSNEVQLQYQISRRWSFEGVYGDQRIGSADLLWTKKY